MIFFSPNPNQVFACKPQQIETCNIKKRPIWNNCGFAETSLANIYPGDWVELWYMLFWELLTIATELQSFWYEDV